MEYLEEDQDQDQDKDLLRSYENLKSLAEKISKLPQDTHFYIFDILKKNNIHYSMNNNGVFINFENIPNNVVIDVQDVIKLNYIKHVDKQDDINMIKQKENLDTTNHNIHENKTYNLCETSSLSSMYNECKKTIEETAEIDGVKNNIQHIWNTFEKDKQSSKKISVNTFSNAKKKYSRQIITDTKINAPFLEKE